MRTDRSPQLFLPALAILLFVFSGQAGEVRAEDRGYNPRKVSRHLRQDADRGGANLVDVIVTLNTQQDSDTQTSVPRLAAPGARRSERCRFRRSVFQLARCRRWQRTTR